MDDHDEQATLRRLITTHPKASKEELFQLFWEEIKGDEDALRAIALSAFKRLKPYN